jgi:glycosyltransferase involved in cell wall biosynthesis
MSLKVVCVVDKEGTALDRLAKGVIPYHDNLDYCVVDVHPKRPDADQLQRFEEAARDADILDWQYFRTAVMLREKYPWLASKKHILTHNNPYSYKDDNWEWADINVGNNKEITQGLEDQGVENVHHIPITVDAFFWTFKREWNPSKSVIMVANRIEGKKGILPVAIAAADAGLHFILVGAVSDRNYLYEIMQTGEVEFHEQISDEHLRDLYHRSTIHVCNSVDGFESGTMPILESMLCGVPVLTRNVGHVPDLNNGDNLTILDTTDNEDNIAIQHAMQRMLMDTKQLDAQRQSAWNTAKNHNFERRAYEYQKLYRKLMHDAPPVSVIVPIYDKPEVIRACLNAVANQDYPNIELMVCDDFERKEDELRTEAFWENIRIVEDFKKTVSLPVRHIFTGRGDYGLARARNLGAIGATGEILVFCDQRQIMQPNAISELVNNLVPKTWVYGDKGGKKDFVENFSAVYRHEFIVAGMFCERMDGYGGLSQEIRSRTRMQGMRHVFVESAKANPMGTSKRKHTERLEIIRIKNRLAKMGL